MSKRIYVRNIDTSLKVYSGWNQCKTETRGQIGWREGLVDLVYFINERLYEGAASRVLCAYVVNCQKEGLSQEQACEERPEPSHMSSRFLFVQQEFWPWDLSQRKHGEWKGQIITWETTLLRNSLGSLLLKSISGMSSCSQLHSNLAFLWEFPWLLQTWIHTRLLNTYECRALCGGLMGWKWG